MVTTFGIFLFLTLIQAKHLALDWVVQTDYQLKNKGKWLHPGGIQHSGDHAFATLMILWLIIGIHVLPALLLAAGEFIIHYLTDYTKVHLTKNFTPAAKEYWILMGLDQYVHQMTYVLIACFLLIH